MFNRLKKFFGGKAEEPDPIQDEKLAKEWSEHKSGLMEEILGRPHNMVMHAIIPYAIGGGLDLYYYPHGIPGTAIATQELSELPNVGSSNASFSCYEMAMFTRHAVKLDIARDPSTPFGKEHCKISSILNQLAPYSATAKLNKNETCEFPAAMESVGGMCLLFDAYGSKSDKMVRCFGILAVIEIYRSEMEFARAQGGAELISKLKAAGHYPYSDMDRKPVV